MTRRDIPNLISVFRIVLVLPILIMMLNRRFDLALLLFAIAGASDGLDGFLAKRYQWQSELGGWLDPIADKILLVTSFLVLASIGLLPIWLMVSVIVRDLIIVTGGIIYFTHIEQVNADPSLISKLNTVTQITLVLIVMFSEGFFILPSWLIENMIWAVLATTVLSGVHYVWVWGRRARESTKI